MSKTKNVNQNLNVSPHNRFIVSMSTELDILKRRLERERQGRKQAEAILEQKALELFYANQKLQKLNESLEKTVKERTMALQKSELRLTTLIANLQAGILVTDEKGVIILVNEFFRHIFKVDLPIEKIIGANETDLLINKKSFFEEPDLYDEKIKALLNHKKIVAGEELHLIDGRVLIRDFIPIFVKDKYLGQLWQYQDVSEQNYAQERLYRSEEKYRSIIENLALGLLEVNNDGVIIKIQNDVYRHWIDKDGKRFIKNITPVFEFDSYDELEKILQTKI